MFRISGSDFVRSLAVIFAAVTLSFTVGCSSDSTSNTPVDSGPTNCDLAGVEALFTANCATSTCHDATSKTSGLDLTAGADLATRLVGVVPNSLSYLCNTGATATEAYLTAHTTPAAGILISKITQAMPVCGARMPFGKAALTTAQIACVQSWANSVTSP